MNPPSRYDLATELLTKGVALQQKGRFAEARSLYQQVLEIVPDHPDAYHLLGVIEISNENYPVAISLIEKALRASPNSSVFLGNLGVALRHEGRIDEAIQAYNKALQVSPGSNDTWFNLGKSLRLQGRNQEAAQAFQRAIQLAPSTASAYLSLISLLIEERRSEDALQVSNMAIERCRPNVELHLSKGAVLKRLGKVEEAISEYELAARLNPTNIDALTRLASTYFSRHQIEEGKKWLDIAHGHSPNHHLVLNTIGLLQNTLGNATAAITFLERSLAQNPSYATTFCNYSNSLRKLGRLSDALEAIQKGRELDPKNPESLLLEAGCCLSVGNVEDAIDRFRRAIELRGKFRDAHDGLLMAMQYHPEITPEKLLAEHQSWWQCVSTELKIDVISGTTIPRLEASGYRPLRIGFTSADLGAHPVGYFTYQLFKHLDRGQFQSFVYSDRIGRDWLASRIELETHQWLDTAAMSDEALREKIQADQIDILFDLSGHTAHNRLGMFAMRAAPIQISWAGYVGTTGLQTMDYLLADRFHIPVGFESHYTESILRMPNDYVTYTPPDDAPEVGPLPALQKGYVTYGAMCNPAKINRKVLEHWGAILRNVPNARMLLCYSGIPDRINRERIESVFAEYGCESRIDFDQTNGASALMERYNQVDIALDTFPYSGGLTTIEAMWMGVPTITWPHRTFAGRHSLSHLSNVGLTDFIADSSEDYISKATRWGLAVGELEQVRRSLRQRVIASPICDGKMFANDFADLMLQVAK